MFVRPSTTTGFVRVFFSELPLRRVFFLIFPLIVYSNFNLEALREEIS